MVTQRYITEFIPKALDVSEKLRAENASEKYVWTTGAWLIWKYLHTASPKEVERLEAAIRRGDIVWNSVPYTVESESMNRDLFETCLLLSHKLDEKYGKKTIAAKMTDVPGHTAQYCGSDEPCRDSFPAHRRESGLSDSWRTGILPLEGYGWKRIDIGLSAGLWFGEYSSGRKSGDLD